MCTEELLSRTMNLLTNRSECSFAVNVVVANRSYFNMLNEGIHDPLTSVVDLLLQLKPSHRHGRRIFLGVVVTCCLELPGL